MVPGSGACLFRRHGNRRPGPWIAAYATRASCPSRTRWKAPSTSSWTPCWTYARRSSAKRSSRSSSASCPGAASRTVKVIVSHLAGARPVPALYSRALSRSRDQVDRAAPPMRPGWHRNSRRWPRSGARKSAKRYGLKVLKEGDPGLSSEPYAVHRTGQKKAGPDRPR